MSIKGDAIVGKIEDPRKQAYVEWVIPKYFKRSQKADIAIQSPVFHFAKETWCLKLYPNGQREEKSVGWMCLALVNMSTINNSTLVSFTLGVKFCNDKMRKCLPTNAEFTEEKYMYIVNKLIERSFLIKYQKNLAPEGVLTLFCDVKQEFPGIDTNKSSQTASAHGTSALIQDFSTLLHSERKCDVIFRIKEQTFRVHKLILGARSPVFAAMFEHDMKENSTGEVNIEDCDADIFRQFLSFIYTGTIEGITPKNFSRLFMLSDKYGLGDLKVMCVDFMKENLCLDIVCEVMGLADSHDLKDLKASAKELIVNNIKTLLFTEQWFSFMGKNPSLAAELLATVIPDAKC